MTTFLALDPGTYKTGVALFVGTRLEDYWLCEVKKSLEIEERIPELLSQLDDIVRAHAEIQAVACEKISGMADRPAPELQTFVRRLRRWATQRPHKFAWTEYHPSTVVAAVRPRGLAGNGTKEIMRVGVQFLYGVGGRSFDHEALDQNVIDSIAVGHCHISKTYEADLLEGL